MNEIVEMQCLRCESDMQVKVTEFVAGKPATRSHPAEGADITFSIVPHIRFRGGRLKCSLVNETMRTEEQAMIEATIMSHFASKLEPDFEG